MFLSTRLTQWFDEYEDDVNLNPAEHRQEIWD